MASPAIGIRPRWSTKSSVDFSHPLTQGLVSAHNSVGQDLTGKYDLSMGGFSGHTQSIFGPASNRAGGSRYEIVIGTAHPLCLQPPLTFVWVGEVVTIATGNNVFYGATQGHGNASPWLCASIICNGSSFAIMGNSAGSFYNTNGTNTVVIGPFVVAISISSAGRELWVNGKRDVTGAGVTTITYYSTSSFGFTDYQGASGGPINVLGLAYNRMLTANEHQALYVDPFCMLRR